MRIRILTDSAADFTQQELAVHDITCVPMQINFGTDTYTDGVDLSPDTFWQKLIAGESPKTSQPSPDAFLSVFEEAKAAGDAVVCVLLSSALSGTLQSALIAKGMVEDAQIYIVDSLMAAVAQKVLVLRACQLRDAGGLSAGELAAQLEAFRSRIKLYACLDTLMYLARGGRISPAAASIGSLVQFKPLITLSHDGKVELVGKAIGRHRAFEAMTKLAKAARVDDAFPILPIYSHTSENCEAFIAKIHASGINCREEDAMPIGVTVSTHIGPSAYGFVYVEAED